MMASSTRCSRKISGLVALAAFWCALILPLFAHADGIAVKKATLAFEEDSYVLEGEFDIGLTPTLVEALNKGVSLYFLLEFELIRPRWYWLNEKIAGFHQRYRLTYNALTRQYRMGVGNLYQNFSTLSEALEVMSRVRRREELEPDAISKGVTYSASLRLRLDTTRLPKPFQINALGSREWNIGSDWYRWTVTP